MWGSPPFWPGYVAWPALLAVNEAPLGWVMPSCRDKPEG